ncbi:MAG TPA: type II toxin-antitoxin system prevent-host-death family antitoxin [Candidatus Binatia bacterium]|nr:type II toxin-antitoxin system prevent-host-death family antitoxin [Candidatus Binatia bacterium]
MTKLDDVIGVRELRAHLSAYLRAVARGDTVTIGDRRRRPIARLVPMERDPEREHFERLAREGRLRLPTGPKPGAFRGVRPRPGAKLVSDIVLEGRR